MPRVNSIRFLLVAALCSIGGIEARVFAQDAVDKQLSEKLQQLIDAHDGDVAVSVKHLTTGATFHHRNNDVMPTASLIKFPVMIEAYRQIAAGELDLTAAITLTADDKVPGSGVLTKHFSDGAILTPRDAIRLMIAYSDNTATNLVLDRIGLSSTADTMQQMGFSETKIHSKVYRGNTSVFPERSRLYGLGSTTSSDMIALLDRLHRRELVSPEASEEMLEHLLACENHEMLPSLLPEDVKVAHKSGAVSKSRTDAGILFTDSGPIAVCVLTSNNSDQSWGDSNAGEVLGGRIARTVFDHFNPPDSAITPDRVTLRQGDFGEMVEAVQRTLNARLDPSPELAIDGDFGPATLAAVTSFQRTNKLETTGVTGPEFWQAISPLITEDSPVAPPDVINGEELPVDESDPLDGPPFVTCKAWAVADADSGTLLFGDNTDRPLDIASTTKIMTAYVVLKFAGEHPDVLKETVVFSRRADRTRGSTSGIREAEQLPVSEVLYGLLLPSGNDASVALAEHFGERLDRARMSSAGVREHEAATEPHESNDSTAGDGSAEASPSRIDPLILFVLEMNRTAGELAMVNTTFRNPHGLTEDGHRSSASDLLKLATAAMRLPEFRGYVRTRQRGCEVVGPGGYKRNVVWKNSNRLLAIDGYSGVKTGTTGDAGACLVSHAKRDDSELLMVILGSDSSASRYVDSRNLYRWAWRQLAP